MPKRKKRRHRTAVKMVLAGILLCALLLGAEHRMRPMIETVAAYQARLLATRNINDAVLDIVQEENVQYNNIVNVRQGIEGQVTSLTTDMVTMNRLKAQVTNRVSEYLEKQTMQEVKIPVGTLIGGSVFSGRGPLVEFRLFPAGYVETDLYNDFQPAGINQTLHRIMMTVKVRVVGVIPFYSVTADVNTSICLAQTVIVGKAPSSYTDIEGGVSPFISQYDYGLQAREKLPQEE
ncbi:MAG: sporulation protein YunB [Oscillospiraceae bacterium]|nr:sporulation protein YunB [Oscillospiraceae bacterium]MCI9362723.1 sporulation protein YunB [Oscillospiraceae bacterium]